MDRSAAGFEITGLSFSYGNTPCLQDISVRLEPGNFYGIIGPNGSGKSTLLDLLAGHNHVPRRTVLLEGVPIEAYSRRQFAKLLTSVPQSFSLNFDYSVWDVVMMGRHPHIQRFARPSTSDTTAVEKALLLMDICQFKNRSVRELSGGEQQRVMIARALAQETPYLLLDEVTAHLDIKHCLSIMSTMSDLVGNGATVISALHDLNMALSFCDRILVLNNGKLENFGPAGQVISKETIENLYEVSAEIYHTASGTDHIQYIYRS